MPERMFPIMDAGDYRFRDDLEKMRAAGLSVVVIAIPWEMISTPACEKQAHWNHGQSLERLAQRGGLAACEANCILEGKGLQTIIGRARGDDLALARDHLTLLAHIRRFEAMRATPNPEANNG